MKLDVENLRYLSRDDFRVLTAVEMGMRNHDLVPTELIGAIAGLKHGGSHKVLSNLLRNKLVYHERKDYDGYRLTYAGYDYLALKSMLQKNVIAGVGRQIGVGKESDIFLVVDEEGETLALKLQRLGRTSFRTIKKNRDYLGNRRNASWMYMSRLGAMREFAFMQALHAAGFPTPTPVENNRHALLMSLVRGTTLNNIRSGGLEPEAVPVVHATCMRLIARLAHCGLVHCDFNEFNIMVGPPDGAEEAAPTPFQIAAGMAAAPVEGAEPSSAVAGAAPKVTMIDFPQMVSTSHPNAEELFNRDVGVLRLFFAKRFGYESDAVPSWAAVTGPVRNPTPAAPTVAQLADAPTGEPSAPAAGSAGSDGFTASESALVRRLDLLVEASGFSQDHLSAFEELMAGSRAGQALAEHRRATGGGAAGDTVDEEDEEGEEEDGEEGVEGEGEEEEGPGARAYEAHHHHAEGAPASAGAAAELAPSDSRNASEAGFVTLSAEVMNAPEDGEREGGESEDGPDGAMGADGADGEDGDDSDGDSDEDDDGEDDSDGEDAPRRPVVLASEADLASQRPPDGVRTRPGGSRIRPKKGKAAAAAAAAAERRGEGGDGAGGRHGGGVDPDVLKERVKDGLERKARKEELSAATRGGTKTRNNMKDREKTRVNAEVRRGDWW